MSDIDADPADAGTTEPTRRTGLTRRRVVAFGALGLLLWLAAAGILLTLAVNDADRGRAQLESLRGGLTPTAMLDGEVEGELLDARGDLAAARSKATSPVMAPLKLLPGISRQTRSVDRLASAGVDAIDTGVAALQDARALLDGPLPTGRERVALFAELSRIASDAQATVDALELGPSNNLLGPLAAARTSASTGIGEVSTALGRTAAIADALHAIFDGERNLLLLASNNAEMRSGSGMFLQIGPLGVDNGRIIAGDLTEARKLQLERGVVDADSETYADRWGFLAPSREFRNLAASPRFPVTAELATRMWAANDLDPVDGVLAVDPFALQAILRATGPLTVNDVRVTADNVTDLLLHDQYKGIGAIPELDDQLERREQLGDIASAVIAALGDRPIEPSVLLDTLQRAAHKRNIMAWSPNPVVQAGWEAAGIDGELEADSVMVSMLNRGANKLDFFLRMDGALDLTRTDDGELRGELTVNIRNLLPEGEAGYVAGPFPQVDETTAYGDYYGILSITLPGFARNAKIEGVGDTVVAGPDGPTLTVAARVLLTRGDAAVATVTFDLPGEMESINIEPTNRVRPFKWRIGNRTFEDDRSHRVRIFA